VLRAFIRAMHNRVAPGVDSREVTFGDLAVLAPMVLAILALALYPQFGLKRSQPAAQASVAAPAFAQHGERAGIVGAAAPATAGGTSDGGTP
jgi:NADH-quinone oxidoreductase subunit M